MQWQYRTILFELTKDGLLGDKYVDDEEMEKTLNQMGGQGWELINVALLQDGVLAFLKQPVVGQGRVAGEPVVAAPPAPVPPVIRSRYAAAATAPAAAEVTSVPEPDQAIEAEPVRIAERPRKIEPWNDDPDHIGGIRIS